MLGPLVVLAVLAGTVGFVNIDDGLTTLLNGWLPRETERFVTDGGFKWWIALASTAAGLAGLGVAWLVYGAKVLRAEQISRAIEPVPEILENKYYLDWLYEELLVKRVRLGGTAFLLSQWDRYVIDGAVNGVATVARWRADQVKLAQAGQAQLYASAMFIGVVGAIVGLLIVNPPCGCRADVHDLPAARGSCGNFASARGGGGSGKMAGGAGLLSSSGWRAVHVRRL